MTRTCFVTVACVDDLTNEKALVSNQINIITFESDSLYILLENLNGTSTFPGKSQDR